jgi:vacuolar-type H+-ATPase subunit H
MSKPTRNKESVTSADAMNTALQAEQHALKAIRDCEEEAAGIIAAAQQQARAITERTNRRIAEVHAHCARVTGKQIDNMLKEDTGKVDQAIRAKEGACTLEAVVDSVAARLTGEEEHDTPST